MALHALTTADREGTMITDSDTATFTSFDGLVLEGTVTTPTGTLNGRAILVHGMTADREEWGFFTQLSQHLRTLGIASLRFDYRCHGASSGIPATDLSLGGIINDVNAAYEHLLTRFPDPALPTFIFAVSFSGGVTAAWASALTSKPAKLFLCAPVLDYLADIDKTCGDWRQDLALQGFFDYSVLRLARPLVNDISIIDVTGALKSSTFPIVIIHGVEDRDVPIAQSRRVISLTPLASLIEVPNADHGFVSPGDLDGTSPGTMANYGLVFAHIEQQCREVFRA
jgi:pimeloyl-ACP methyl ester carboxylesterase